MEKAKKHINLVINGVLIICVIVLAISLINFYNGAKEKEKAEQELKVFCSDLNLEIKSTGRVTIDQLKGANFCLYSNKDEEVKLIVKFRKGSVIKEDLELKAGECLQKQYTSNTDGFVQLKDIDYIEVDSKSCSGIKDLVIDMGPLTH
ncbi:hypothetical protein HYW76_01755 [Candidatus Pacearchaeota archaeon]|nr:hypothetical protein [Candidatus Pacearchaeota archaeon]